MRGPSETGSQGGQPSSMIPSDYEKLIGTDFILAVKRDPEAVLLLEAQVGSWISWLKNKVGIEPQKKRRPTTVNSPTNQTKS